MKIRTGFVSNSSSSSFVVSLKGLNPLVANKIIALTKKHNNNSSEGYLTIRKNFVFGRIDQCDDSGLYDYVKSNVAKEDWSCE